MDDVAEECPRQIYLFGSCKFEARYDTIPPPPSACAGLKTSVGGADVFIRALTKTVYVRDVCIRCGKTVERSLPQKERQ